MSASSVLEKNSALRTKAHPHPVLPPDTRLEAQAPKTPGTRGEGQSDKDISIAPWHYQTFSRIDAGIAQRIEQICAKHFVHADFTAGWLAWFEASVMDEFKKWWAAWLRLNELAAEGRTDAEAQKLFNEQVRIYRDISYRVMEQYIGWKKDKEAAARAAAAGMGKQEALFMNRA